MFFGFMEPNDWACTGIAGTNQTRMVYIDDLNDLCVARTWLYTLVERRFGTGTAGTAQTYISKG